MILSWNCENFLLSYSYFVSLLKYISENYTVSCVKLLRDCNGRTRRCHISLRNYSEQVWRIGHSCTFFSSNNMPLGYVGLYPGLFVFRFSTLPCLPNPCTSLTLLPLHLPPRLPATGTIHSHVSPRHCKTFQHTFWCTQLILYQLMLTQLVRKLPYFVEIKGSSLGVIIDYSF